MKAHKHTSENSLNSQSKDTNLNTITPTFDFSIIDSIGIDDITAEAEHLITQGNEAKESKGLFTVKTASRWIRAGENPTYSKNAF
jgi:hypothetical protein